MGINEIDQEPFNSLVATGEVALPWLQDTPMESVWDRWQASWRDVRILDSQNRPSAVFNLFDHDLRDSENRTALKELFLATAKVVDSDGDGLPDDWEQRYLGGKAAYPHEDADGDGRDNFTEFSFGTDPKDMQSSSPVRPKLLSDGRPTYLSVTFRRRAGSILDYIVEASPDLEHWSASTAEITMKKAPRNLYDGTGTAEVTYSLVKPISESAQRFVRVRAVPRQRP